eukprot:scaffold16869_cov19-Prasinocladus_malaysianus.AAC.1
MSGEFMTNDNATGVHEYSIGDVPRKLCSPAWTLLWTLWTLQWTFLLGYAGNDLRNDVIYARVCT